MLDTCNTLLKLLPLPLNQAMQIASQLERSGYYQATAAIGSKGDFITAPEISQIFGEIVAVTLLPQLKKLHQAKMPLHLVELGGGSGQLMADVMRTLTKLCPELVQMINIHIVDSNVTLRQQQQSKLSNYKNIHWYANVNLLALDLPIVVIANEFFDALPIKQYQYHQQQWYEAYLDYDEAGYKLIWNLVSPIEQQLLNNNYHCKCGYVIELATVGEQIFTSLAKQIKTCGGCMLTIDYGYEQLPNKSTLRGYLNHQIVDHIKFFDQCDLTFDVNFANLIKIVRIWILPQRFPLKANGS